MAALSYGLNIKKKPASLSGRPPPGKRKTIFDEDCNSENDLEEKPALEEVTTIGGVTSSKSTSSSNNKNAPSNKAASKKATPISQYGDLSANHTSTLHAATAQSIDASIYDYDSVYDSLHSKSSASTTTSKGPKYMSNLLAAAEVRKRDQLRAKEKLLAKEREAEGDTFIDKEKFVTDAYKAQQEEVRRLEEEEVKRELAEMERRKKGGGGMVGLYKGILERGEQKHEEVVLAAEEQAKKGPHTAAVGDGQHEKKEKSEVELAREKGAVVNDDGQVVDKRELLSAGLNIAPKPVSAKPTASATAHPSRPSGPQGRGISSAKQAMRERQSRMLEEQLEEVAKRAVDEDALKREEVERAAKRRLTEKDIGSAKERYLARKREAEEAKMKAKEKGKEKGTKKGE